MDDLGHLLCVIIIAALVIGAIMLFLALFGEGIAMVAGIVFLGIPSLVFDWLSKQCSPPVLRWVCSSFIGLVAYPIIFGVLCNWITHTVPVGSHEEGWWPFKTQVVDYGVRPFFEVIFWLDLMLTAGIVVAARLFVFNALTGEAKPNAGGSGNT
jgi:hypothetical protein